MAILSIKRGLVIMVTLCLLTGISSVIAQTLEIHCVDVEQGDCTFIVSPTGQTMLVDCGDIDQVANVESYINGLGYTNVDYFIPSHYHADHIGGIGANNGLIDRGMTFDAVYDRGWEYCTWIYDNYVDDVTPVRHTIYDGQVFDLGGGVTVTCLGFNGNGQLNEPYISDNCSGGGPNDENDFCISLRVDYNHFQFFVAGDLSGYNTSNYKDIETSIGADCGDVEVYQVNHHGSMNSSNTTFLNDLMPEVSVISVGANGYGHPHSQAVDRIENVGSVIYQTRDGSGNIIDGDIIITTTGFNQFYVNGDAYDLPTGGTIPIADIQDNYDDYAGLTVDIEGVVTLGDSIYHPLVTNAYIEDSSGKGINLFDSVKHSELRFGSWVSLSGRVDENAGTTRLVDLADITVIDVNQYVWDTPFTTGAANDIAWEGARMWVGGEAQSITDNGGNTTIVINDGSGDLDLYIGDNSGVDPTGYAVGDYVRAYGVCDVAVYEPDTSYKIIVGYQYDISNSPYTVKMIPENYPIEVPNSGGYFEFTAILNNETSEYYAPDVWIKVKLPNGSFYGPVQRFNNLPLPPNYGYSASGTRQNVPPAQPGDYQYWAFAGNYPSVTLDSNFFPFRITSGDMLTMTDATRNDNWGGDWHNFGIYRGSECDPANNINQQTAGLPAMLTADNYPNPFNPVTTIHYALPSAGNVRLDVYNMLGQRIRTLVDDFMEAGNHRVAWNAEQYSSGVYFYVINYDEARITKRMLLVK
ncbi:MAG: T9SS type A sorting domain-containing protein [candidate division Zixibacteria bacterium]|nr:T9SS type A sorting domain-containing protein [candidate division Zixibacteria bacterium]